MKVVIDNFGFCMLKPSRLLPKNSQPLFRFIGWIALFGFAAGGVYLAWQYPLLLFVCAGALSVWVFMENWRFQHYLEKLAVARAGESIRTFTEIIDLRQVDRLVVRAVYEQVQSYLDAPAGKVPLRWQDDLAKDLRIDQGDLEEIIVVDIAQRTGRSLSAAESNPYHGKIHTMGDLVLFFNAQPMEQET
ncbi:MAG: hypothetical protein Q8L69_00350 [Gallionellaceae bacterium]|nr:hypothetical protein [Gallionellaceae bacterium]